MQVFGHQTDGHDVADTMLLADVVTVLHDVDRPSFDRRTKFVGS